MNLLPATEYHKLIEPIKKVSINNLFARWVIEGHLPGRVYVDNVSNPLTFYVVHSYGMSLLFGNFTNEKFNQELRNYALNKDRTRHKFAWMQAFS
jgi:hypothetical protein